MEKNNRAFAFMLIFSQALGIAMVVLVVVWTAKVMHGFAWDGSPKQFNLHPFCMVCGFMLLYAEAALSFRVFAEQEKIIIKILHATLHILAFVGMVIGLQAAFDFHNFHHFPNVYSLHSWCGMATVLLFTMQYVLGFVSYLFPKLETSIRQSYLPVHKYFGFAILFLATMSSISGINEQLLLLYPGKKYSARPYGAVIGNSLGLVITAFIVVVGFILSNPAWERKDDGEREPISLHFQPRSADGERGVAE